MYEEGKRASPTRRVQWWTESVESIRFEHGMRGILPAIALPVFIMLLWVVPRIGVLVGLLAVGAWVASLYAPGWLVRHVPRWARILLGLAGCGIFVGCFLGPFVPAARALSIENVRMFGLLSIVSALLEAALWEVLPRRRRQHVIDDV